jgi:hypothetical protein
MPSSMIAQRILSGSRSGVLLSNGLIRALIDSMGGMVPEFSVKYGDGFLNSHWIPGFRGHSGEGWRVGDKSYWKDQLHCNIAGNFLCSPTFGAGFSREGQDCPTHGWTANETWTIERIGTNDELAASFAFVKSTLRTPIPSMALSYTKYDIVMDDQPVHYSYLRIRNHSPVVCAMNLAWHNTVGPSFLQAGCRVGVSADRFSTPPADQSSGDINRLAAETEFRGLASAPLRRGGTVDLGYVPGMIGSTDFIVGAIPESADLGWSCVVNPMLNLAYTAFFPGPAATPEGEVSLGFNALWMQYGGRPFTPWALYEGGSDQTFCLGTENIVGGFANGLDFSLSRTKILGKPTVVTIDPGKDVGLCYGTALVAYDGGSLSDGVTSIAADAREIVLQGGGGKARAPAFGDFKGLREAVSILDKY